MNWVGFGTNRQRLGVTMSKPDWYTVDLTNKTGSKFFIGEFEVNIIKSLYGDNQWYAGVSVYDPHVDIHYMLHNIPILQDIAEITVDINKIKAEFLRILFNDFDEMLSKFGYTSDSQLRPTVAGNLDTELKYGIGLGG